MEIKYRNETTYGNNIYDVLDVMLNEIYELGNIDILDYTLDIYMSNSNYYELITEMINDITAFNQTEIFSVCKEIISEINKQLNKDIKYCLWLADKEAVEELYGNDYIMGYYCSDIILSDLGYEGKLYAYENKPEPII